MKLSDQLKSYGATNFQLVDGAANHTITFSHNGKSYRLGKWFAGGRLAYVLTWGRKYRKEFQSETEVANFFMPQETIEEYTDDSPMPFGKYVGIPLSDVPDSYFLYLYETGKMGRLRAYILDNLDAFRLNVKEKNMLLR